MVTVRSLETARSSLVSSGRSRFDLPTSAALAATINDYDRETGTQGKLRLWSGATHANLVGILAFGRFQSTVSASKDLPLSLSETTATSDDSAGVRGDTDSFATDAATALEEENLLFNGWMASAEPACVDTFLAVEACTGGYDRGGHDVGGSATEKHNGPRPEAASDVSWGKLKGVCSRAIGEDGRGPRGASLQEVVLFFKHLCRLGCRRRVLGVQLSVGSQAHAVSRISRGEWRLG